MIDILIVLIGLGIAFLTKKANKEKVNEIIDVPIEQNNSNLRANFLKAEQDNQKNIDYKKAIDVRQFARRDDVTNEEVIDYIIAHKRYEGWINICYILDAISLVCNINEENVKEIKKYLWKNVSFNESDEDKKINEYNKEKYRKLDKKIKLNNDLFWNKYKGTEVERIWQGLEHKEILDEKEKDMLKMTYYYEDWLKEKGYV